MITTAWTAALLALLVTALSLQVSRLRLRYRVSLGDGGHKDLLAASRAHGNTLEQSLLFLVLLAAYESLAGADRGLTQGVAMAFIAARVAYAVGVYGRVNRLRQAAHVATLLLQLLLAAVILRLV